MKEIRVALIGFGGIARSHAKGYARLAAEGEALRLVAVCGEHGVDRRRHALAGAEHVALLRPYSGQHQRLLGRGVHRSLQRGLPRAL